MYVLFSEQSIALKSILYISYDKLVKLYIYIYNLSSILPCELLEEPWFIYLQLAKQFLIHWNYQRVKNNTDCWALPGDTDLIDLGCRWQVVVLFKIFPGGVNVQQGLTITVLGAQIFVEWMLFVLQVSIKCFIYIHLSPCLT